MVSELKESSGRLEAIKKLLKPMAKKANQEEVLDGIMMLISEEVIERTLERLNPEARTSAARLLLKRADQRRVDRRLKALEAAVKKQPEGETERPWSAAEKQERIRQILGTE